MKLSEEHRMKKPKLNFRVKRPMLFYQEAECSNFTITGSRLRIIYPDGYAEWISLAPISICADFTHLPCWMEFWDKTISARHTVKEMRKFDRSWNFQKAIFLGYL